MVVFLWSAEALLTVAGAACALRFEPELGDWSCRELWMDKNNFRRHRQGGPEVQLRAGQRSANPPGHPHNLEENHLIFNVISSELLSGEGMSLRGTCNAERSEASRSLNVRVLITMNEILRLRCTSANDIVQEPIISSEARNPHDAVCGDTCDEDKPKISIGE